MLGSIDPTLKSEQKSADDLQVWSIIIFTQETLWETMRWTSGVNICSDVIFSYLLPSCFSGSCPAAAYRLYRRADSTAYKSELPFSLSAPSLSFYHLQSGPGETVLHFRTHPFVLQTLISATVLASDSTQPSEMVFRPRLSCRAATVIDVSAQVWTVGLYRPRNHTWQVAC